MGQTRPSERTTALPRRINTQGHSDSHQDPSQLDEGKKKHTSSRFSMRPDIGEQARPTYTQ